MRDFDYNLFATIVERGSLSAAARALQTSPAMVSKRLSQMEQRLGVRLIHRTTRKLVLTAPGERFYDDVKQILGAIDEAESRLIGVRSEPSGPLRVSAPTSFGRLHIAPSLNRFLQQFPLVELELDLTDENVDLYVSRVDLAIRITSDIPGNVHACRLAANQRILCASPDYIARNGAPTDFNDLQHHRLVAADGQLPWRLENGPHRRLLDGKSHVRTNSSEIARELAICGVGIALRSLWDIDLALKVGKLVPILPEWQAPTDLAIYALHQKTPLPSAAVSAFVDFLQDILDPPPWDLTL